MTTDAIAGGVAEGLLYMANSAAIKNQARICAEGEISKNANRTNLGLNVQGDQSTRLQNTDQSALHKLAKEAARNAKKGSPISYEEAQILDEWAKEYNVPQHHTAQIGSGHHFPGGNSVKESRGQPKTGALKQAIEK